jgi:hypothetical protein
MDSKFQLDIIVDNDIDLDGYGACEGTLVKFLNYYFIYLFT